MTGNRKKLGMLMLACSLLPACGAMAADSATITIPITIINPQNTCKVGFEGPTISGGNTYTFQEVLIKGEKAKQHASFRAVVTCEENSQVNTALMLGPGGGRQTHDNKIGLFRLDDPTASSGDLWLTLEDGSMAPMATIAGGTSVSFCTGMASDTVRNSCTLTPVTDILASAVGGAVSTTLTFAVVYP